MCSHKSKIKLITSKNKLIKVIPCTCVNKLSKQQIAARMLKGIHVEWYC